MDIYLHPVHKSILAIKYPMTMTLKSTVWIQQVHPKGDQSWVFIGRTVAEAETPILWPPHAKS